MLEIYVTLFTLFVTFFFNFVSKKYQFLIDKKFTPHKSFVSNELTPVTGGIIFCFALFIFLPFESHIIMIFLFLVFGIGLLSDLNYLISPTKRFFLQVLTILTFIFFSQTFISSVRINFIDLLLNNIFFSYFLTMFCLLILINGANFMDGVNTLFLGYFLGITVILFLVIHKLGISIDWQNFTIIIFILSILLIFNVFGRLLSGDSGAYSISFLLGFFLIKISNLSSLVSPYFVACLLWYPAYECLFSIIRKKILKLSVTKPDNNHLHHLVLVYLKNNFSLKKNYLNTFTGLIINMFNYLIFYNAYQNISQTKNLVLLMVISILFYNLIYFYLNKTFKN